MVLAVTYAGVWLARDTAFEGATSRAAAWAAGGTVTVAAVAALLLFSQRVTSGSLARASYLTVDLVTVGALAGVLVGLYDARSRSRLRELAAERDRVEAVAGKAADVNNYGRAIASAPSVDGVAAFVVEAFGTMTGMEETAVIRSGTAMRWRSRTRFGPSPSTSSPSSRRPSGHRTGSGHRSRPAVPRRHPRVSHRLRVGSGSGR